ncbi:MAG: hypothetical protein QM599_06720 [Pseudoxanthomonas sp.]
MSMSVLQIVESCGGWNLIDDGKPSLWFPEHGKALEIAKVMADARSLFAGIPTIVRGMQDGREEVLADYRPCPGP